MGKPTYLQLSGSVGTVLDPGSAILQIFLRQGNLLCAGNFFGAMNTIGADSGKLHVTVFKLDTD